MSEQSNLTVPLSPVLLSPREALVVDGASVTFEWEPVEGAEAYLLQVVADPSFEEIVYEEHAGAATSVTVKDTFETDGRTYYWRVLAKNEAGWSHGENVESFVSATADVAARHIVAPDLIEPGGPLAQLVKADAPSAVLSGEEAVEVEGVDVGPLVKAALTLALLIVVAVVVVFQWTNLEVQRVRVEATRDSGYPALREYEAASASKLTQYAVVDAAAGVYRIPIDRAIERVVAERMREGGGRYTSELQLLPNP
jgi:hypothetical protein